MVQLKTGLQEGSDLRFKDSMWVQKQCVLILRAIYEHGLEPAEIPAFAVKGANRVVLEYASRTAATAAVAAPSNAGARPPRASAGKSGHAEKQRFGKLGPGEWCQNKTCNRVHPGHCFRDPR